MAKQLINLSPSDQVALSSDIQRKADWFMGHPSAGDHHHVIASSTPVSITLNPYEMETVVVSNGVSASMTVCFDIGSLPVGGAYEYMMYVNVGTSSTLSITWPAYSGTYLVIPRTSQDVDFTADVGDQMFYMQEIAGVSSTSRRVLVSKVNLNLVST